MSNMNIIEIIRTIFLEFNFIKDHIFKKTNERLMQKKISSMSFDIKRYDQPPSKATREIFQKHTNTN